jgi:hypothetical protein
MCLKFKEKEVKRTFILLMLLGVWSSFNFLIPE